MHKISTLEKEELVSEALKNAISYAEYRVLVSKHAESFTSTGHTQTESLSNYTILNDRRMKRWDKVFKLSGDFINQLVFNSQPINWIVLTESWCGDAAHTMPIMNKIAEQVENLNFKVALRDDNPQLMDAFLTNGAMSIPKLIAQDPITGKILGSWGPRPSIATKMVADYKKEYGTLTPNFKEDLQLWYNKDKGENTAQDLVVFLKENHQNF